MFITILWKLEYIIQSIIIRKQFKIKLNKIYIIKSRFISKSKIDIYTNTSRKLALPDEYRTDISDFSQFEAWPSDVPATL